MLLNVFRQDSELPKQQVQLYRRGLLASIEEANDARRQSLQTWRLDLRSKLIVAARIAASCLFSNRSEIWIGHQSQVAPIRAVVLSEIAGGYEPSLLSSFHVGEAELREALLTSLFVPIGTNLFGWTHQTFAEFLSAYYLVEHHLTAEELLDFLRSGEATGRIPPQLIEVAAWAASMQPDFFRTLIRLEPAILLRSDVAALPEDREALVRELLQRFDSEELHDFHQDFLSRYGRFNHPRLAQQIRPYILAKSKNRIVRRVAIDIAQANNLVELANLLADVALDATDDIHIRAQAASAVWRISHPDPKARLKPLVAKDHEEDVDDELKGYALRALWPGQLSVPELLRSLTLPKKYNFFGAYAFFLIELEVPALSEADALIVLDWMTRVLKDEKHHTTFDRVIPKLLTSVCNSSDIDSVRSRLAEFLLQAVCDGAYWSYSENIKRSFVALSIDNDRRKALIISILRRETENTERDQAALLSGGPIPLLNREDLPWLVSLLIEEVKSETKRSLANIIVGQTFGRSLDEISFVWDAADDYPFLLEAYTGIYRRSFLRCRKMAAGRLSAQATERCRGTGSAVCNGQPNRE
jgi:hypothetical protein